MSSRNNELNRRNRQRIHREVDHAISLIQQGRREAAKVALEAARATLSECAPFNGGSVWQDEYAHHRRTLAILQEPCRCFYCSLSADQKTKLKESVAAKQDDLRTVYADDDNNYIGAYAEVVFGFRYNLPINLVRGFDGGKDFTVPFAKTPSGILTIDVKGTVHGSDGRHCFPWIPNWIVRENHIYVLLQIVEHHHVFFRGFAFGNDKPTVQIQYEGTKKHFLERPGPSRTLEEFDNLIF